MHAYDADHASFAQLLRAHREAVFLSQEALAACAGLSVRAISDLERGIKQRPHHHTLERLVRALALTDEQAAAFRALSGRGPRTVSHVRADTVPQPSPGLPAAQSTLPETSRVDQRRPARPRDNLPLALTSFIGREQAQARVRELLGSHRLVTLTGAGGCGKTRLAMQVAGSVLESYADGVWLVDLAAVADPVHAASAALEAVGARDEPGRWALETLIAHLREKFLLLVLDNCEHLVRACAGLAAALLRDCPQVRILATSREELGVAGEQLYRVASLSLPRASRFRPEEIGASEAVQLFVERARAHAPGFVLGDATLSAVVDICTRLDGIPLAIELAAGRVRALPVQTIAARLDDSFRLLTRGPRAVLPRQQTLQAALDWSYNMLSERERILLCRLAVFAGGWALEAAEAICGEPAVAPDPPAAQIRQKAGRRAALPDAESPQPAPGQIGLGAEETLDLLTQLVSKSLVIADSQGADVRYNLLEIVRQYARERLKATGEAASIQQRHAWYYRQLAEAAEPALAGPEQSAWLARLTLEHDNMQRALQWARQTGAAEFGLRLAGTLWRFWQVRGHVSEGHQWLEEFMAQAERAAAPIPTSVRATACEQPAFGPLLRGFRLARGMTQETLAERAGLSSRAVSDLERGINRTARISTLGLLADALHLGVDERALLLASAQESAGRAASQPPEGASAPRVPVWPSHNLPAVSTSLVGRMQEVAAVAALVRRPAARLVTLTGSGGVGKTRLALAAAMALLDDFAGGVWLVELAPLADPALVPAAAARALGLREEARRTPTQVLCEHLAAGSVLLLLDNCEHLVEGCAGLASALLRACPHLHILATSRECLEVPGEQLYVVPPLRAPDPRHLPSAELAGGYEAVRLFEERARERRDDFVLSAQNARAVAEICARLDGVPLAIELAAARAGSLGLETIAQRLDQSLQLLTGGPRTAPLRQQTLRGALAWSWALLADPERLLLRRLAVFAGGWTVASAEAVCQGQGLDAWAVLDGLDGLVARSLTQQVAGEGDERRYRLLEPVRQYAAEQLAMAGEEAPVWECHLRWAVTLAERAAEALTGPEQEVWLAQLETEHDNLRAALAWSLRSGFAGLGLQLAGALWRFWVMHGHLSEGRRWLEQVLGHGDAAAASASLRARAYNGAGNLAWWQGDFAKARTQLEEALALRRELADTAGIAGSLNNLGIVAYLQGDFATARAHCAESLALYRELGDTWGRATSLHNLGLVTQQQGDVEQARSLYQESLALYRELRDRQGIANSLGGMADLAYLQGDLKGAQDVYEECLALYRELGDRQGLADSLSGLGQVHVRLGDYARARELLAESLALYRLLGDDSRIAVALEGLARLVTAQGQPGRGVLIWGAIDTLRQESGKPRPPSERGIYDQDIATLHTALGAAAFESAWAAGRALPLDAALALALDSGDPP